MKRSVEKDRQLLSRCLSGNRKASETLVRRFSDLVYRSVQHTLLVKNVPFNRHDLEDLHNTVFLRLFENKCKKLRQYRGKNGCSVASWIRMIAVRTVIDHLRKKGIDAMAGQKDRIPLDKLPELKADGSDFVNLKEQAERERLLDLGMKSLPPRDRLLLRLHIDQRLSIAEVADAMQVTVENAYSIKHRAIQRLKSHVASSLNINP